jgi:hypothetical protein
MENQLDLGLEGERVVYLKPVDVADLPLEVQEQAGDLDMLYAVHNAEGNQIALITNMRLARELASEYQVSLHNVH